MGWHYGSTNENVVTSLTTGQVVNLTLNKNVCSGDVGGTAFSHTYSTQTFTCPYTLHLFGLSRGIDMGSSPTKLYSCKIYDNGTLIRNYIPVIDNKGITCLYDTVNKTYNYLQTVSGGASNIIPANYTQVEYIQSTGTQYIDTGFKPNQNSGLTIDAKPVGASATQIHCVFGCRGADLYWELYKASTSNETLYYFYGPTYGPGFTIDWTARQIFAINKNVATVDGQTLSYDEQTFQLSYTVFIGADNNGGSVAGITPMRIYSCQIYDNDTLVRDYIPVTDASGVACLYDKVEKKTYYNAGTGNFTTP